MKTFSVFTENSEMVELLSDEDAGKLLKAMFRHAKGADPGEMPMATQILYMVMAGQADRMEEAYQEAQRMRSERAKKAASARYSLQEDAQACSRMPTNTNTNTNTKTNTKTKTIRFVRPTLEEVTAYCEERKNNVDATKFIDFYESKGWKVGDQPMKDWKACVRTWERRNDVKQTSTGTVWKPGSFGDFNQRKPGDPDYKDLDEIIFTELHGKRKPEYGG